MRLRAPAPVGSVTVTTPSQYVTTPDHVNIAVYDFGGDGPPLLLAHATGFHALVFRPLAELLATSFHCYAFDTRGHGDSGEPPGRDFSWAGFGRDVLAVVQGLDLHHPLAVGHSAGGAGLLTAEHEQPGTFRALYAYEPVVFPSAAPAGGASLGGPTLADSARRRREVFASREEARANFAQKAPLSSFAPEALDAYVEHGFADLPDGTVRLKCRAENEALVYDNGPLNGVWDRLPGVRCPVTIAFGARSVNLGRTLMEQVAQQLPAARTEELAGLEHLGPMEDPVAVADSVRRAFAGT